MAEHVQNCLSRERAMVGGCLGLQERLCLRSEEVEPYDDCRCKGLQADRWSRAERLFVAVDDSTNRVRSDRSTIGTPRHEHATQFLHPVEGADVLPVENRELTGSRHENV